MGRVRTKTVKKSAKVIIEYVATISMALPTSSLLTSTQALLPEAHPRFRDQQEDMRRDSHHCLEASA